jgi:catechol 2,3-dioxygenase-like lactoylglutathione lyase family enzyme
MIIGSHVIIYTRNAEADRAFLKDVLGLSFVDAGHGWLIFALPPAEVGVHPADENDRHELHLMCDDLAAEMKALAAKGVAFGPVSEQPWGKVTRMGLPGGGELSLYEPLHPTAFKA